MTATSEIDPKGRHELVQPSPEPPSSSASQAFAAEASSLTENATKIQKGNAAASEAALREVMSLKNGDGLKDVAQDLEKSGNAKFTYGPNGDIEHIIFNSSDGKPAVDMDLQHEQINGKSAAQIREAEISQAKEYLAAGFSDPKITDSSGQPLSPQAQVAAKKLMGALLDGDVAAMAKAGQLIMKNPEMANSIQSVVNRIQGLNVIEFQPDEKGQLYMKANTGEGDSVIVPASGAASAESFDVWGKRDDSQHPALDTTMKSASDWSLFQASSQIDASEGYLEMVDRLPADGYTNMQDLERASFTSHPGDGAKLDALIEKSLSEMTPDERAYFDKIHSGGHQPDDEEQREEEEQQQEQ